MMSTYPNSIKETKDSKTESKARPSAILTFLLFFCVVFSLRFWLLLFHEGGHALPDLIAGNVIKVLYAHPFTFGGWVTPTSDTVISAAAGPVMMVLVPLLLFILIWKHRSVALLPLVFLVAQSIDRLRRLHPFIHSILYPTQSKYISLRI